MKLKRSNCGSEINKLHNFQSNSKFLTKWFCLWVSRTKCFFSWGAASFANVLISAILRIWLMLQCTMDVNFHKINGSAHQGMKYIMRFVGQKIGRGEWDWTVSIRTIEPMIPITGRLELWDMIEAARPRGLGNRFSKFSLVRYDGKRRACGWTNKRLTSIPEP